jgi:RHH-type proline utilization regulon transcriptional repressor/proline dehydrogenase/delta 1-pyrroline-5-carboxylate dehydrogenase
MTPAIFQRQDSSENELVKELLPMAKLREAQQQNVLAMGKKFVTKIRAARGFSMEEFLQRYNLSNEEGIAVLGLVEGLLRIPDSKVSAELITDKLSNKNWEASLFKGSKSIKTIIASFGLYFSGKFTDIVKSRNTISKLLEEGWPTNFCQNIKSNHSCFKQRICFCK